MTTTFTMEEIYWDYTLWTSFYQYKICNYPYEINIFSIIFNLMGFIHMAYLCIFKQIILMCEKFDKCSHKIL